MLVKNSHILRLPNSFASGSGMEVEAVHEFPIKNCEINSEYMIELNNTQVLTKNF